MSEQTKLTPEAAVMVLKAPQDESGPSMALRAEAVQTLAELVDQNVPEFVDLVDDDGMPACWHFVGYQSGGMRNDILNEPEAPQYQGVIFADGTVAMRWLTARRSHSVWSSFGEMFDVHGHPEYGTRIVWPDGAPQEALDVIRAAALAHQEKEAQRQAADTPSPGELAYAEHRAALARQLEQAEENAGIVRTDSGEHYDPTQDNTGPGSADSERGSGWSVGGLAELTEEQAAEIIATHPVHRPGGAW